MTDDLRRAAIRLYDTFTHEHRDRRRLLREMTLLAGSVAAAEGLIAGIAASPAAARQVAADDKRLKTGRGQGTEADAPFAAYFAQPAAPKGKLATVMVIHENRGLNAHTEDVARRVALAGFRAIAPDFLAPQGGTPRDEDKAREMIGAADYDLVLAQARGVLARARADEGTNGKAGAVGFCWGGGLVNRLAVAAGGDLDAGVSYYGPAPDPAEAAKVQAPMMLQLAGNDERVNKTALPWGEALKAAGKQVVVHTYADVEHAFNNDTSAERYDENAAKLAWDRTLTFFRTHLG